MGTRRYNTPAKVFPAKYAAGVANTYCTYHRKKSAWKSYDNKVISNAVFSCPVSILDTFGKFKIELS